LEHMRLTQSLHPDWGRFHSPHMLRPVQILRASRPHGERAQCQIMMNFSELASVSSDRPAPFTDPLRLAVAAYLARFKGLLPRGHRIRPPLPHPPAVRGLANRSPALRPSLRLRSGSHARPAGPADLRGHRSRHRRPG